MGSDGDDLISGGGGNNTIHGGIGNDILRVEDYSRTSDRGKNVLYGDAGNDTLIAGNGNDTLFAGAGDDILYAVQAKKGKVSSLHRFNGGEGRDKFIIGNAFYVIEDFNPSQDSITRANSLQPGTNMHAEQLGSNVRITMESSSSSSSRSFTTVVNANVDDVTNSLGI